MTLEKHLSKLISARDEMDRVIAALSTVIAYTGVSGHKRMGRPPGVKNAVKDSPKKGDEKTGVKKSTFTKPFKTKKIKKKRMGFAKRRITPEGEARRRAGYFAYVERMKRERAAKASRKPAGKSQSIAA